MDESKKLLLYHTFIGIFKKTGDHVVSVFTIPESSEKEGFHILYVHLLLMLQQQGKKSKKKSLLVSNNVRHAT